MKIVITGGHHNSALVLAFKLKQKGHEIFWFGHKHTIWKEKSLSAEYLEVSLANIPFFELISGKFYQTKSWRKWLQLSLGFFQSLYLLIKIKPDIIVSFGGYLAVPVVIAGNLLGIKAITHEQTTEAGMANKLIASYVNKVFVTWKSSLSFFPADKTMVVGLPLRNTLINKKVVKVFKNDKKTILILGGKQGSHLINGLIEPILGKLLPKYNLIHQTGNLLITNDFGRLNQLKQKLPKTWQKQYCLKPYFFGWEMDKMLHEADLVISRAGAHIVYELAALGKPVIFIPISWSQGNEQYKNALKLQECGTAVILDEKLVDSQKLLKTVDDCMQNLNKLRSNAKQAQALVSLNAAQKMVEYLENIKKNH